MRLCGSIVVRLPMRWGLIPSWWKKTAKDVPSTFNARAESVADKPMFRSAFKRNRCIIPASGYFEWKKMPGKQPYFISAADGSVLSIAGLWDRWHTDTGETVLSCTMIVTDANAFTRAVHNRMPVLLDRSDLKAWLSGAAGPELLRPTAEDRLRMWPVSRRVPVDCAAAKDHMRRCKISCPNARGLRCRCHPGTDHAAACHHRCQQAAEVPDRRTDARGAA
jgi:putative SOS response-associated peptidase YedK